LYSTRERLLFAVKLLAVAAPVYLAGFYWLFPWLRRYMQTANCEYFVGISALQLLIYGVFVGIPLSMALLVWLIDGARSLRVWRLGQHPLPGEKVLRKTRYRYGAAARLRPLAVFAILILLIGAAIRGGAQAPVLIAEIGPCDTPGQQRSQRREARPKPQASGKLNW
jgi:hypothetical protein